MRRDRAPSRVDELRDSIENARAENRRLHDLWTDVSRRYWDLQMKLIDHPADQEMVEAAADLAEQRKQIDTQFIQIDADIEVWKQELARVQSLYQRPMSWWARVVSTGLGPLPSDLSDIEYDAAEFGRVPSRWWLSVVTVFTVLAGVIGLYTFVPIGGVSPLNLAIGSDMASDVVTGILTGLVVVIVCLRLLGRIRITEMFYVLALEEELWFRAGAEKWTFRQRVTSCLLFGLAHVINLFYVVATLGMLAFAGAVFMAVYLQELRKTGDIRRAVIAATKVHAQYNCVAFGIALLTLGIYWSGQIASVLT